MKNINLYVDNVAYNVKPKGRTVGAISNRITKHSKNLSPKDLALELEQGKTVMLGLMREHKRRNKINFHFQDVLMLDFDNSINKEKSSGELYTSIQSILDNDFIKENASFLYKTQSYQQDWEKFRVVFILEKPIFDSTKVEEIYEELFKLFPTVDISCKDSTRLFYGGFEYIEINFENILNISQFKLDGDVSNSDFPNDLIRENFTELQISNTKNWQKITLETEDIDYLKNIFGTNEKRLHSKVQAVNYLKEVNLVEFLGLSSNNFKDIFTDESSASSSIFQINGSNIWLYKCHSTNYPFVGDIIKVTQNLLNVDYIVALEYLMDIFNIKIEVTEKIQRIREQCELFSNIIVSIDLPQIYPEVNKMFWRYKTDIYTILNIFKENIYEDKNGNIRSLTWMSTRNLSTQLYGTEKNFKKVSDILNLLTYSNWIAKLSNDDIPKELLEQLLRNQKNKHFSKRSNVFELLLLENNFFDVLNEFCRQKNEEGFTRKGFSMESVKRIIGEDKAKQIFVQNDVKPLSDLDEAIIKEITVYTLNNIYEFGFVVEKDIISHITSIYPKRISETRYKQILGELILNYDLVRVRLSNKVKEDLNIVWEDRTSPIILTNKT